MKILEISKESEESFRKIYDSALKGGGMQFHSIVKKVIDAVKQMDENDEIKYIEFTDEIDRNLHAICDTALKTLGMEAHPHVQHLIDSIKDKKENR